LAGPLIARCPGGPSLSIAFWNKFCPVDFNRASAACLIFAYHDYYIHQAGKGYPVFAGRRYQTGHGLGSIFGGLFKAALPLLKKGAKTLGREVLKTGLNIAGDVDVWSFFAR
jgi:hypothetical protein